MQEVGVMNKFCSLKKGSAGRGQKNSTPSLLLVVTDVEREKKQIYLYKKEGLFECKVVSKFENNRWKTCEVP
ncbi:unnamed protein product [Onchocerca flexuosa]|uniref:Uncharacterized protein n=1 Tax=Onchocerca flexuosa TaxID=387005 RepID=A0A183HE25_9BILA|nr:unnamed protein product [Onchocerca flexuosa]